MCGAGLHMTWHARKYLRWSMGQLVFRMCQILYRKNSYRLGAMLKAEDFSLWFGPWFKAIFFWKTQKEIFIMFVDWLPLTQDSKWSTVTLGLYPVSPLLIDLPRRNQHEGLVACYCLAERRQQSQDGTTVSERQKQTSESNPDLMSVL